MDSAGITGRHRWLGVFAITSGALAAWHVLNGDTRWAAVAWPWLLLALAVVNLVRSAVTLGSLIGPTVLAAAACGGLVVEPGTACSALVTLVFAGVAVLGGLALLRTSARTPGWTRVMTTGRVRVPAAPGPRVILRAVAGELRADFTQATLGRSLTVQVTAVAGHVRLVVPRAWPVVVLSAGTMLTQVTDTVGPDEADADAPRYLGLHLLGLCGAVSLVRV